MFKNYKPIFLLPVYNNIFERLIYNELFTFFTDKMISPNQSGFRPGDCCVNQLLAINTHEIYRSFDTNLK